MARRNIKIDLRLSEQEMERLRRDVARSGWSREKYLSTLTEGDEVILTTLWSEDYYCVSGVAVIAPDDIASAMIQPGRELLTLLTCHPYASGGKYRLLAICEKEVSEVVP